MESERERLLKGILEKIAAEQNYNSPVYVISTIPDTGSHFTSQLFQATIKSSSKKDLNLFAKVIVVGETTRKDFGSLDIFQRESHFYTKLGKIYQDLEEKHNVPKENRLNISKFYGASDEYMKEILVLEDLTKDGYTTDDRLICMDWECASKAVEELAKLHALSIAFQEKCPAAFKEMKPMLECLQANNDMVQDMLNVSIQQATGVIREENRERFKRFLISHDPNKFGEFYKVFKIPVIAHCDFRQNNVMHKIDEDGKLKIVIVDYQGLSVSSVFTDLIFFIFTGSDGKFRAKYFEQLIEHYYENLTASLRRLGMDPEVAFPKADFDEELKKKLPFGLMVACYALPLLTLDAWDFSTTDKGGKIETLSDTISKAHNPLYTTRINEVVDDYIRWGIL